MNDMDLEISGMLSQTKSSYVFQYTLGYRESHSTDNGSEEHKSKETLYEHISRILNIWQHVTDGGCDLFMHISNNMNERIMITAGLIDNTGMIVVSIWSKNEHSELYIESKEDLDDVTTEIERFLQEI